MSLATSIGQEMNLCCETDGHAHRVTFDSPVLLYSDMQQLLTLSDQHYRNTILDINFDPQEKISNKRCWLRVTKPNKWCAKEPF